MDFEIALVLAILDGVEDNGGVHDGFAVELLGDSNFDVGCGGRRFVLTTALYGGVLILSLGQARSKDQKENQYGERPDGAT